MKTYMRASKWYVDFTVAVPNQKPLRYQLSTGLDISASKKAAEKRGLELYAAKKEEAAKPKPKAVGVGQTKIDPKLTIKAALADYARYLTAKGSKRNINSFVCRLVGENEVGFSFGPDALCTSVTQQDIDQIVTARAELKLSANYTLTEISILKCALDRAGFPVPRLRRGTLPVPKLKTRILSHDEYHRLMDELTPREWVERPNKKTGGTHRYPIPPVYLKAQQTIKDMAIFLFFTGARWGEMRACRWSDIDFANREISLGTLKQKSGIKTRWCGMPDDLHVILIRRWAEISDSPDAKDAYLFPGRDGTSKREEGVCQPLMRAFERAGLNADKGKLERYGTFSAHGCRHQNATWLIRSKVPLPAVSRLLGHANIQQTMRYVNLDERETVKLATAALANIAGKQPPPAAE